MDIARDSARWRFLHCDRLCSLVTVSAFPWAWARRVRAADGISHSSSLMVNCTLDDVVLTCWPPGPLERANWKDTARAGTLMPRGVSRSSTLQIVPDSWPADRMVGLGSQDTASIDVRCVASNARFSIPGEQQYEVGKRICSVSGFQKAWNVTSLKLAAALITTVERLARGTSVSTFDLRSEARVPPSTDGRW